MASLVNVLSYAFKVRESLFINSVMKAIANIIMGKKFDFLFVKISVLILVVY